MSLNPFQAPRIKIDRAKFHYAAMLETLSAYQAEAKPVFVLSSRSEMPWQVEVQAPVPYVVALQLGDIAHSLRSSLDITMCDIALARGVGVSDMVFPFAIDEARFNAMLTESNSKRPFKKLGSDIVSAIVECKPYGGGNAMLRGLHDLNNHDKHRMAVPYASFVSTTGTYNKMFRELGLNGLMIGGPLIGLDIGVPLPFLTWRDNPAEEYIFNPTSIIITFPANYVLFGNVITVMGQLIDHVAELVETFAVKAGF